MADNTSRFPSGLTNSAPNSGAMSNLAVINQGKNHEFFTDFNTFTATNYTVTRSSTTAAVLAVSDADGGILTVTNAAADDANTFIQTGSEIYTFNTGKELWFETRAKVNDATQSDLIFGLVVRDTSPLVNTSGVYFIKNDDVATIDFVSRSSSSAIQTDSAIATLSSSTYYRFGFYYDGKSKLYAYVDNNWVAQQDLTTVPTTELAITWGIQNGAAAAKTLSMDYINVVKQR